MTLGNSFKPLIGNLTGVQIIGKNAIGSLWIQYTRRFINDKKTNISEKVLNKKFFKEYLYIASIEKSESQL